MLTNNIRRAFRLMIVGFITTIALTGCFKGEFAVYVKPNGSGIMSYSFGVTQQAKALLGRDGSDPVEEIKKSMADGSNTEKDINTTSWIDGEYEWIKAEKEFANLDELNKLLKKNKALNDFSLTRTRGLLRNEFTLEAELGPLNDNSLGNDVNFDPSAFIQINFAARLPGKIIETNGLQDINDPNRMVWNMASKQGVSIKARSVTWNWISIFAIIGLLMVVGLIVIGSGGYFLYSRTRKNKVVTPSQPAESLPIPTTNIPAMDFETLGIEKLFVDINDKVLNHEAQIRKGPGEIALVWRTNLEQERLIEIKALEGDQITINGQVCPANKKDARAGILDALRKEVKK